MLRKILTTIGTRYLVAILNLALIFINAKELGIEGVGLVGVLVASVNIAVIFNGILCGNTLIYFMNRYSLRRIIVPAYVWTLAGSGLACGFMLVTTLLPTTYWKEIYGLAILTTLANANARFLLGKERIKAFNLTGADQGLQPDAGAARRIALLRPRLPLFRGPAPDGRVLHSGTLRGQRHRLPLQFLPPHPAGHP